MTRAVYIVGAPGSGKTHAVTTVVNMMGGFGEEIHVCRETFANELSCGDGWVLGRVREKFSGTDACGRAASGWFRKWIESGGELPGMLIGEGERFAYIKFLDALRHHTHLTIVYLSVSEEVRQERLKNRDGEGSKMLTNAGRAIASRVENLVGDLEMLDFDVREFDTTDASVADTANFIRSVCEA